MGRDDYNYNDSTSTARQYSHIHQPITPAPVRYTPIHTYPASRPGVGVSRPLAFTSPSADPSSPSVCRP